MPNRLVDIIRQLGEPCVVENQVGVSENGGELVDRWAVYFPKRRENPHIYRSFSETKAYLENLVTHHHQIALSVRQVSAQALALLALSTV